MPHSSFTPNPPSSEQHGTFQTLSPPLTLTPCSCHEVPIPQSPFMWCSAETPLPDSSSPRTKAWPVFIHPHPKEGRWCLLTLSIQYHILLLLTLKTLSLVPGTSSKRASHSFHPLGAPTPARCTEGLRIMATKTHHPLALPSRWDCFQVQSQISMWGETSGAHVLTKSSGWEKPEVLLVSPIGRGKTRAGVQTQIHTYPYWHAPHSPSVVPTARRAPITATWRKHFLGPIPILSSFQQPKALDGQGQAPI